MTSANTHDGSPPRSPIDWQAALKENEGWLRTVLFARLGDRAAVDEVLQEVSLAALKQASSDSSAAGKSRVDPGKVAPWLYRVAVRQGLLYRRRMGRARKLTGRYAERFQPTESDGGSHDPLGWLMADERRSLIRRAMGQLPPRDAEMLMLKYNEGWSYQQIAKHLGTTENSVESRLHRARARLRSNLTALQVVETA